MNKNLKVLLAGISTLTFSVTAMAVDFSGSGRVRYVEKNNKDFNSTTSDKKSSTGMRFRLSAKATTGSKSFVFMQPQFTKVMGESSTGAPGASGDLADTSVTAHQMYFNYDISKEHHFQAGRMEINLGDQLLIGSVGYDDTGRSFDGFLYSGKCLISGTNSVFALKTKESGKFKDENIYGVYHAQSLGPVKNFDLYFLNLDNRVATTINTNFNTYGLRMKSDHGSLDYRVEATGQKGKFAGADLKENQFDVEVGYKLPFMGARLGVEYFQASKAFNQLKPTGHKWLGSADMFSRKNVKGFAVHYLMKLAEKTKFLADFHMFSRTDTAVSAAQFDGTAYAGVANTEKAIANELDLALKHKLDEGLGMKLGYSLVLPGKHLKALSTTYKDNMSYMYAEFTANF